MRPSKISGDSERSQQVAFLSFVNVAAMHGYAAAWEYDKSGKLPAFTGEYRHPELAWLHAIPNGAAFGSAKDKSGRAYRGARMKEEGLKPGVPDLFFPYPANGRAGLYIEMKRPDGGTVSDKQQAFIDYASSVGYDCVVRRTWFEAAMALEEYHVG